MIEGRDNGRWRPKMGPRPGPATPTPRGGEGTNFPVLMHRPTFTNVYWNLNIKKIRAAQGGPLNRGAPCHGIIGILVNPALYRAQGVMPHLWTRFNSLRTTEKLKTRNKLKKIAYSIGLNDCQTISSKPLVVYTCSINNMSWVKHATQTVICKISVLVHLAMQ